MKQPVASPVVSSSCGPARSTFPFVMWLLLCALLLNTLPLTATGTGWLSPEWKHRTAVTIQHSGAVLTDYQVNVSLDLSFPFADAQLRGRDMRVTACTSAGAHDLAVIGTSQSSGTAGGLPTDGSTVYATLYGYANGTWTVQDTATYTAGP